MTSIPLNVMRLVLVVLFLAFLSPVEPVGEHLDTEKISNKLEGWEFRSYSSIPNFLPNSKNHKILIISLIDGSLMAVDSDTGTIFWTIREHDNFINRQCTSFGCYFFHSTGDQVYFLNDGLAHLVTSDNFGWLKLKKSLSIVNSHLDVATIGINVLTGKFYFFSSSKSCFKNSTDSPVSETLDDLLIIKRTKKIIQIIDVETQQEILKLSTISHDISSYHFNQDNLIPPKFSSNLNYDIRNHVLYGHESDVKTESANCWSVSFNSPISKMWEITKTATFFTVLPIDLLNIISVNSVKISKAFEFESNLISSNLFYKNCNTHLIQVYFKEYSFLQNVGLNSDQNCILQPILSTLNISNLTLKPKRFSKREFLLKPLRKSVKYASQMTLIPRHIGNYVTSIKHLRFFANWKLFDVKKDDERALPGVRQKKRVAAKKFIKEFSFTSVFVIVTLFLFYIFSRQYQKKYHPATEEKSCSVDEKEEKINEIKKSFKKEFFRKPQESDSEGSEDCKLLTPPLSSRYADEFHHLEKIGKGGYGEVFKARKYMDNCVYAVKRITVSDCIFAKERTMREVQALAQLNHPGIIRFYAAWFESAPEPDFTDPAKKIFCDNIYDENRDYDSRNVISDTNSLKSEDIDIEFEYDSKHPRPTNPLWTKSIDSSNGLYREDSERDNRTDKTIPAKCHCQHGSQHLKSIYLFIQMELCHEQTLRSFLIKHEKRHIPTVMSIFSQILNAVKYFHSRNLMHRDLKPSNIFFSNEGDVKIGDFGLVARFNFEKTKDLSIEIDPSDDETSTIDTITKQVGTELYMAPELIEKRSYDFKVDIYSLGLIFFELLVPFHTQCHRALVLTQVKELNFPADLKEISPDSVQLIKLMLSYNPNNRPSISQILNMDITARILSCAEHIEEAKQKVVNILSEIGDIHTYSDCSI